MCSVFWLFWFVSTSASDWLERLVSEMTYNVLMETLNPTRLLIHWLSITWADWSFKSATHYYWREVYSGDVILTVGFDSVAAVIFSLTVIKIKSKIIDFS